MWMWTPENVGVSIVSGPIRLATYFPIYLNQDLGRQDCGHCQQC